LNSQLIEEGRHLFCSTGLGWHGHEQGRDGVPQASAAVQQAAGAGGYWEAIPLDASFLCHPFFVDI
jgi:hypothetical protein